jgi:hypothetical protein
MKEVGTGRVIDTQADQTTHLTGGQRRKKVAPFSLDDLDEEEEEEKAEGEGRARESVRRNTPMFLNSGRDGEVSGEASRTLEPGSRRSESVGLEDNVVATKSDRPLLAPLDEESGGGVGGGRASGPVTSEGQEIRSLDETEGVERTPGTGTDLNSQIAILLMKREREDELSRVMVELPNFVATEHDPYVWVSDVTERADEVGASEEEKLRILRKAVGTTVNGTIRGIIRASGKSEDLATFVDVLTKSFSQKDRLSVEHEYTSFRWTSGKFDAALAELVRRESALKARGVTTYTPLEVQVRSMIGRKNLATLVQKEGEGVLENSFDEFCGAVRRKLRDPFHSLSSGPRPSGEGEPPIKRQRGQTWKHYGRDSSASTCHLCGQEGHWKRDCPTAKKNNTQV